MPLLYETMQRLSPKYVTRVVIFLTKAGTTSPSIEGTTVDVGQAVRIRGFLQYQVGTTWYALKGTKSLKFYHRLNTGAWELIATKDYKADGGVFPADLDGYVLAVSGRHGFTVRFDGDAENEASTSKEANVGAGVAVGIPKEYLIGGALAAVGLVFVALALKRRR